MDTDMKSPGSSMAELTCEYVHLPKCRLEPLVTMVIESR
jgi:hypothetical protein